MKIDLLDKYKISLCFHHELYHYIIIVDDIDVRLFDQRNQQLFFYFWIQTEIKSSNQTKLFNSKIHIVISIF